VQTIILNPSQTTQGAFTNDWFTIHVPKFISSIELLRTTAVNVLEIGSFEGLSTTWFLHFFNQNSSIVCVDTFEGGLEHVDSDGKPQQFLTGLQERFFDNVAFERSRLDVRIGTSETILFTFKPQSFDVIYVDGSHHAADALTDIVLAFHLLKIGGIMMIDDVGGGGQTDDTTLENIRATPRLAVQPFLTLFQERIEVLHAGYQVHLRKLK
jgi:predicted O-methyltransferase YrrM